MSVRDISELQPATASLVTAYLDRLERALARTDAAEAATVREDVEAHILEILTAESQVEDAETVLAELGEPDEYADAPAAAPESSGTGSGTFLGMPYDVRVPTAERVASRWWNPRDPRIFMPRVWGIGWDLNFGAIAVRLHLIEPDAEDEPFAEVPRSVLGAALVVPTALTGFIVVSYLLVRAQLPDQVPVHWGLTGQPDRFGDAPGAFAMLLLLAAAPTVWAVRSFLVNNSALRVAAVGALASLMSAVAASVWFLTMWSALGRGVSGWAFVAGIVIAFGIPLVQLTTLARIGRDREVKRDLNARTGA